ncbi:MAG: C-type lectin domain-containing protein [Proteobacteria bacterium]|nr:C-type lectin domain-containing protein [Pseudomonadota bacterium]
MRVLLAGLVLLSLPACLPGAEFSCLDHGDCPGGRCEQNGYCSAPDPSCESGQRFSDNAADEVAGTCVPCPAGSAVDSADNRCYVAIDDEASWQGAQRGCIARLGPDWHLADIADAGENQLVLLAADSEDYWIGGSDSQQEGVWQWSDGNPIEFFNWAPGAPDNSGEDCLELDGATGLWDDAECDDSKEYLCERP